MATFQERKAAARERLTSPPRPEYVDKWGQLWRKLPNCDAYTKVREHKQEQERAQEDAWWASVPIYQEVWQQHQQQRSAAATSTAAPSPTPQPVKPTPAEPTFKVDLEPDNDAPALCS